MNTTPCLPAAPRPRGALPTLPTRRAALAFLALGLAAARCGAAGADSDSVSLETARAEVEVGRVILIDIREPNEHANGVVAGARLLPMSQLNARVAEIPTADSPPVLLICNTQNRSSATWKALRERGYTNVRFVQGGMSEWYKRGWPTVKPAS